MLKLIGAVLCILLSVLSTFAQNITLGNFSKAKRSETAEKSAPEKRAVENKGLFGGN